jgi:protein-tyrosine phosphatase
MRTILFVCSGNTCRSPLAVAAWRAFGAPFLPGYEAVSAGLFAADGSPAADESQQIARSWGMDLSTHRSRHLTDTLAKRAYLICPMTPQQESYLLDGLKIESKRVRLLSDFAAETGNGKLDALESAPILDPIGGSFEAYETCAARIRESVEGLCRVLSTGQIFGEGHSTL